METLFVIFNGPPGSGKSTQCAPMMQQALMELGEQYLGEFGTEVSVEGKDELFHTRVVQDSFAWPMKMFLGCLMGVDYATVDKGKPQSLFSHDTPRQFLIDLSQDHCKAKYGEGFFGRALRERTALYNNKPAFCVIDDGGFDLEVGELTNRVIIRLERPGTDFKGDSRGWLPHDYLINNDGDLQMLRVKIRFVALHIFNKVIAKDAHFLGSPSTAS